MAIGGITGTTAQEVLRAGADSLAVVSSICKAENPELTTKSFLNLIGEKRF
jgi:thiamine-phosphate pyrophosphorylase